ncbi:DUF882 domain-containing protein [Cupriavidus sp. D39]|uniref:DUF882 domain-containing protein n=1 Tax=Cupriavidus sp. D39 TaxID=2997877 RepID=UPI0022716A96|nr:DUF882 domain-containing protein [Cupriavidus sp. D39]MCY0853600.1 DUF882 domain-containing protein [Cupriavidus sp. D39]
MTKPSSDPRRLFLCNTGKLALAGALLPLSARPAFAALATLPEARSLAFDHTHTGERIAIVYAVGEQFVPEALAALNRFLRDHYSGEVGMIDPQLFALLYRLKQTLSCESPFQVISGYRSPATNAHLRKTRGGGVASHSLHMDGKAIDIRLPGVSLVDLRDAALSLRGGGVGFYPQEQFVHADTGRVRNW